MTDSDITALPFASSALELWRSTDDRHRNWPVVYTLNDRRQVYVGETLNAAKRLEQHLRTDSKKHLATARVIVEGTFNKSVCLDLESFLIRLFAGDGRFEVLNRNDGITDAEYFDRSSYRRTFASIFERLRAEGLFDGTVRDIENSDLFKLSPFKALNEDQTAAVLDIVEGLFDDIERRTTSTAVVQGDPGTGKTIVGVFLMKLLQDIRRAGEEDDGYTDSAFAELFTAGHPELVRDLRIGLVVPQQSLRRTVRTVFTKTAGLSADLVLSPFDVGRSVQRWDLLVVDETHRLSRRANQSSGMLNAAFRDATIRLFGEDDPSRTQLDWIRAQSDHQVFLLDAAQSVRPADLAPSALVGLSSNADRAGRRYRLRSQMRLTAGAGYLDHVEALLDGTASRPFADPAYDLRLFDDLGEMRRAIRERNEQFGLARMVAGYAWPWRSRRDPSAFDIEIDGERMRWNSTETDWIASKRSIDEVGSIHTVQGYDLNYAGVIIGNDLRYDPASGRTLADRASYFDKKGRENNPRLGVRITDDDLTVFIRNIYRVLMTRGIRGTYVYVSDPFLRARVAATMVADGPIRE